MIRADVAGRGGDLVSYGSSGIVDPHGRVLQSARPLEPDLIVAEIDALWIGAAERPTRVST